MSNYKCDWCNRTYKLTTDTPCYDKWAFCWEPCMDKFLENMKDEEPTYSELKAKVRELEASVETELQANSEALDRENELCEGEKYEALAEEYDKAVEKVRELEEENAENRKLLTSVLERRGRRYMVIDNECYLVRKIEAALLKGVV